MTANSKYLAPSKELHNFAEHWTNSSQANPRDNMTLCPPWKGFPGTFVRQQIQFRRYPFCFNLRHVLKHMQMYPLSTAIEWRTGASRRVPPTFGAYVVHLHRGEFPWTKISERFKMWLARPKTPPHIYSSNQPTDHRKILCFPTRPTTSAKKGLRTLHNSRPPP